MSGGLSVNGVVSCTSVVSSSDEAIKQNIEPASLTACQAVFDAVDPKVYQRKDLPQQDRIGFIAQDFEACLPPQFDNIVSETYSKDHGRLLALDYSRICGLLWGVVKGQQARIKKLEETVSEILNLM